PVMTTFAPCSTNSFAVANPMPALPPVTTAIFPSNLLISISSQTVDKSTRQVAQRRGGDNMKLSSVLGFAYEKPVAGSAGPAEIPAPGAIRRHRGLHFRGNHSGFAELGIDAAEHHAGGRAGRR